MINVKEFKDEALLTVIFPTIDDCLNKRREVCAGQCGAIHNKDCECSNLDMVCETSR